ncbi:MAG: ATP-binding cassette domain-containing protein [Candidatus Acidiferrales bacterium]
MSTDARLLARAQGLGKDYAQRRPLTQTKFTVQAFEDVNLAIHRGITLAVVGESGAGKSSLARCLALLERPTKGDFWFEGENLVALPKHELRRMRRQVQLIFQDPSSALSPRLTAGEILAEPLLIQNEGTRAQRRERALELMEQVGLHPDWERKMAREFSGGQRQRLAIARALSLRPKLLIMDEALSNLDIRNQELILTLLSALQVAHSLTYVHISHDLRLVRQFADEVAVMHEGRIVEHEEAWKLFSAPKHFYTQELLGAMSSLESISEERFV